MQQDAPDHTMQGLDPSWDAIVRPNRPRPPRGELPEWELRDFLDLLRTEMRQARWRAGLTQGQVAMMMDTTKSAVSRLERLHPSMPSISTLCRYADAIGCRLSIKFISRSPDSPPYPWDEPL